MQVTCFSGIIISNLFNMQLLDCFQTLHPLLEDGCCGDDDLEDPVLKQVLDIKTKIYLILILKTVSQIYTEESTLI